MKQILSLMSAIIMLFSHGYAQRILSKDQIKQINRSTNIQTSISDITNLQSQFNQKDFSDNSDRGNGDLTFGVGDISIQKIGEASNAYTFIAAINHQISVLDDNVAFIYRQNISDCGGENGTYRISYSADRGDTWDLGDATGSANGCFGLGPLNPDFIRASRYPNLTLFRGENDEVNLAYVGPVLATNNQGWNGHILGVARDITNPTVTQEEYRYQDGGQFLPYSLVERVPGEFWYVAVGSSDGTSEGVEETIVVNKGVYNAQSGQIDWEVNATIAPDFFLGLNGQANFSSPSIAFSPNGQIGFISFTGDLNGKQDSISTPVFIESQNGGATWEAPFEFEMNAFPDLSDSLRLALIIDEPTGDTIPFGNGKGTVVTQTDLVVDKNGYPHLIGTVTNQDYNPATGLTLPENNFLPSSGMFIYDFTKDSTGEWNMLYLGTNKAFSGSFGEGNEEESTIDAGPWYQLSRSSDGSKIFYSWTDTDTTLGTTDNESPNLIGRAFDLDSYNLTPVTNWTENDPTWNGFILMPKASPVALDGDDGNTVPTVFMNLDGNNALTPVSFWYVSDVSYATSDYTENAQFFYNCAQNPIVTNVDVIEPSCGSSDGSITVASSGGLGSFSFAWDANAGLASNSTVSDLAAGVYTVVLEDSVGCTKNISVTLANQDAPTISIEAENTLNISCAGEVDGSATAIITGGTSPYTYEWSNGETDSVSVELPSGVSELRVVDANNCVNFATVSIIEPDTLSIDASITSVSCNGFNDGIINLNSSGGTGQLSYSWENGEVRPLLDSLLAGEYTVTIMDENNCDTTATFTVDEPSALVARVSSTPNANASEPFTGTATITAEPGSGTAPYTYLWSDGSTQSFNFGLCGATYFATITDNNGCTTEDSVVVEGVACITTSLEDELSAGISVWEVFPNPSSSKINLSVSLESVGNLQLSLVDVQGRTLRQVHVENTRTFNESWNLSRMTPGMYFIRIETDKGTASRTLLVQ
ncbi:MAG: T9SS type A sorting domain-containing protein [Bacteroidota bacterium]